MKYELPVLAGWRCTGDHEHEQGEDCPDGYLHKSLVYLKKEFDSLEEANDWIDNQWQKPVGLVWRPNK